MEHNGYVLHNWSRVPSIIWQEATGVFLTFLLTSTTSCLSGSDWSHILTLAYLGYMPSGHMPGQGQPSGQSQLIWNIIGTSCAIGQGSLILYGKKLLTHFLTSCWSCNWLSFRKPRAIYKSILQCIKCASVLVWLHQSTDTTLIVLPWSGHL